MLTESNNTQRNSYPTLSPPLWTRAVIFSAAYFALACLGYYLTLKPGPFINFWLPSGLFVAVLLRHDTRTWPFFLMAAFPANILFDLWNGQRILISLCFFTGNSLEALTGAYLMRRFVDEDPDLSKVRDVIGLILFSAAFSSMVSATIGALTVTRGIGVGTFGEIWLLWWSADVLGILLLAPVILAWRQSSQWGADGKPSAKVIEAALFLVLLTLAAVTIMMIARYVNLGMRYLFLPFLIWAGYRLGIRGTAAAGLWIAILTTWFSIAGYTNFSRLGLTPRMQVAAHQLFLAAITLTGLFLAVALKERRRMEEGLRESEAVYKAMFENNQAVKYLVDPENGRIVEANSAAADYYGYPLSKLQGMTIFEINSLSSAEVRRRMTEAKQLKRYHFYFPHRLASGEVREVEVYGGPIVIQGRDLLFSIVHDITERKQAEKALAEREEKFRHLFNNAQVGMFRTKIDGSEILDVNEKFLEIFGRNKEEMVNAPSVIHWDDPGEREEMIRRLNLEGRVIDFECGMLTKQGERRDCLTSLKIYPEEGILEGSIIDITERKRNEELIKSSLKEKEVLLKEIHHRVKNNLAVISSIIRLQARQTKDPTSKEIMQECDNRIQSMAKIHSKIYQSKDLAGIDFDSYLKELIKDLFKSYQVNPERVKVHLQVRDLKQDLQTTVPLCLILNELISNALKYAFPEGRTGEIGITLQRENGRIGLTIADNGIGFPEEVDFRNTSSLGFQLVMALVKQLHGTIELERKEGTAFIIRFDDEKVEGKEKTSRRLRVEG